MNAITIPLSRRSVALSLPLVIRDRLTLYMRGRYERYTRTQCEAARLAYLRATGRQP